MFKYSLCNFYVRFIKKTSKKERNCHLLSQNIAGGSGTHFKKTLTFLWKKINPQPLPIWLHYIPRDHTFNKLESPLPDYVFNNDNSFSGHLVFEKIVKSFFSVYSYVKMSPHGSLFDNLWSTLTSVPFMIIISTRHLVCFRYSFRY